MLSGHDQGQGTHELSIAMAACTRLTQDHTSHYSSKDAGTSYTASSLVELSPVPGSLKGAEGRRVGFLQGRAT